MITVRLTRWTNSYTRAEHRDVDITNIALWEAPAGWMVAAISTTEKGLPPWEDTVVPGTPKLGTKEAAAYMPPSERIIHTEADDELLA